MIKKQSPTSWSIDVRINKKRIRKSGFKSKSAAENYIFLRKKHATDSMTLAERMEHNFKNMTVNDCAIAYLSHLEKTRSFKSAYFIHRFNALFGETVLSKLEPDSVRNWFDSIIQDGQFSIGTLKVNLTYCKRIFNYAIKTEKIAINPIRSLSYSKYFKGCGVRNFVIRPEKFTAILELFKTDHAKGIIRMLWHTGMRISEVLNLKWSNIDLENGTIVLSSIDVKERKTRTIGIESELHDFLTDWKQLNTKKGLSAKDHCFGVTKDTPYTYDAFWKLWRSTVTKTEFEQFNPHDLRHSWVTRMRRDGHDRELIMLQAGHTSDSMFRRYNDIAVDEVLQLAKFDKEKSDLIAPEIEKLMATAKQKGINLSTITTLIRKNIS